MSSDLQSFFHEEAKIYMLKLFIWNVKWKGEENYRFRGEFSQSDSRVRKSSRSRARLYRGSWYTGTLQVTWSFSFIMHF